MTKQLYTLAPEQIKAAFWRAFHECGTVYFDSMTGKRGNEESTNGHWVTFLAELQAERDKAIEADPHPGAWELPSGLVSEIIKQGVSEWI